MTMTFSGDGTITGLTAGGLPNATVTNDDLSLSANASNVMTALNASGSAPIHACRAWVNFNGTGTVAIRGSGNVSSITDNGTGTYTVNFTNAMPDANYSVVIYNNADSGTNNNSWNNHYLGGAGSRTTTSVGVQSATNAGIADSALFDVVIFR